MAVTRSSKRLLTQIVEVSTEVTKTATSKKRKISTKIETSDDANVNKTKTKISKKETITETNTDTKVEVEIDIKSTTDNKTVTYTSQFAEGLDFIVDIDPSLKPTISKSQFPAFFADLSEIDKSSPAAQYHDDDETCFASLGRGIIGQQVSGAAAKAILGRFKGVFDDSIKEEIFTLVPEMFPTKKEFDLKKREVTERGLRSPFPQPATVLAASDESLRAAGLSNRKVEYMKGLAEAFTDGTLSDEILKSCPDDEVVDKIVALKGFGRELFASGGWALPIPVAPLRGGYPY